MHKTTNATTASLHDRLGLSHRVLAFAAMGIVPSAGNVAIAQASVLEAREMDPKADRKSVG